MHDQDVLNTVCQESLGLLEKTWDAQICNTRQARSSGFHALGATTNVIHFIGSRKPWLPGCRTPHREEYFRYLSLPPWARYAGEFRKVCLRHFLFHSLFLTVEKNGMSAESGYSREFVVPPKK